MIRSAELLKYSFELIKMAIDKESLHKRLIIQTADLQNFESSLFKLCVLHFSNEVTFITEKASLLEKVTNENYCDGVYSVVSNGLITFFDSDDEPLIRLVMNDDYVNEFD